MADAATVTEDSGATAVDVLANDTDPDGGPKTITAKTDGANGTVLVTGGGAGLTYQPAANFCGSDSFTYTLNGGSTATVTMTVTCVDDDPTAVDDSATVAEDSGASAIDVLANDTDPDGGTKTITAKTDGTNGAVAITGGGTGLTYQPAADFCGSDSFTYTLNGGSTATVSVTVTCVDDLPVAVNDAATVAEDAAAIAIDVLANDTDVDGGPKTITAKTDGAHGGVVITGGGSGLTYQPDPDYCGPDSFTYTLNGGSAATVSITVTCVDDAPIAVDDAATVAEDSGASAIDVLANDTDVDGGPKTITAKTDGANGSVVITGGGAGLTYQPAANFCGSDSFTYTLNGGSTATVSVTVTCVDDAPTAVNDSATIDEDAGATAIDVLANDTDPDGGTKTITAKTDGTNGTVVVTGGGTGLTYQPAANFCGSDSFTYTLNGGSSATVSVTVTCINDAPSFTKGPDQASLANQNADGSARTYTINPWGTGISAGPANESGQTVDFVIDSVTPSNLFTVQPAVSATGVLTFTTNPATTGTATIVLHIHDNGGTANGGVDASATQSFTIQTVHPPPVAVNDSYTATGNVGINVNDVAEGVLQRGTDDTLFSATITNCGPTNATATATSGATCTTTSSGGGNVVLNTNGTFTYNPAPGFTGADHFFYRLTNSGGTSTGDVTVTVSDMIWFVKNDALACTTLAAGCGRLAQPFSTLAAFQAVNSGAAPNPQDGQTIFIYTGLGSYAEGVTLRASQRLIGQGAGASITAISGITLAPFSNALPATGGTRPSLTTSVAATNAITLGSGNTVRGLNIGNKTGSGIAGTNFGTLTLSEVDITGSGQAVNLNTGTANATFGALSSSSGTNGVALTSVAGTPTATGGTLTGSTGDELLISGGAGSFTYPGAIANTGGARAVTVASKTGGTIALSGQITDTVGTGDGISLTSNTGATINLTGGVALSTGSVAAFTATGGGTINVTGSANTLATGNATALTVTGTTIGSSGLTFLSIATNGGANGIVLNGTGSTAGLTVTGGGSGAQGGDNSGGTIQSTTGDGISLTNTRSPSFNNMNLQNTAGHGLNGTGVNTSFSFTNGKINGAGDANDESCVSFDDLDANNVSGTFTFTNNQCTQTEANGVDIENWGANLSDVNISNNQFTDTGDVATPGSAVLLIGNSSASTAGVVTKAALNNNTITDFRAGAGFVLQANAPTGAPSVTYGVPGNATNVISVTGNSMDGGNGGIGNQPDRFVTGDVNGSGQGNYNVSNNGTAANRLQHIDCIAIELTKDGPGTLTTTVQNNFINANSAVGCAGIAIGTDDPQNTGVAGTHTTTISGNNVMGTDGPGIFAIIRNSSSTMTAKILNNTAAAPIATNAARAGIRVDSGSAAGDTTLCLEISGNTTAGSTNSATATTSPGINLRKQGTDPAVNTFGIEGLAPSPTGTPTVENFVNGQNTSTSGTFGVNGTALLSAQSGFTSCNAP